MICDKTALSDITVFNKFAKFVPELSRRENSREVVDRNKQMHQKKFPELHDEIESVYENYVHTGRVLPSMRSMQFGGTPILMAENRIYNCAYAPAESYHFFSELMFLLLGGTGMGYSVQKRHVSKLPAIKTPSTVFKYKYQIQDSIVGWADAIKIVFKAFMLGGNLPQFDYRDIREKGADLITTGGKAPGPEPLRECIDLLIELLGTAQGRQLTPFEVHCLACIIADAVLAGGIRRAAMICLFDIDDKDMLLCKSGAWWEDKPYLARANNSAVLLRGSLTKAQFKKLMRSVEKSGCGEPAIYWTHNLDWGTNPCCEIALRPYQMCNLTEINASVVTTQEEFNSVAAAAAFLGTLQAGYTDFHYLRPVWRDTCEDDALLGVSMTGIASGTVTRLDMVEAAYAARVSNRATAAKIGIKPAARVTTVKPAGTTSLYFGCSSGIHAWHGDYYIRRMRAGRDEALAQYMQRVVPELVEDDQTNDKQVVLCFPQAAPKGAITRNESMLDLLERVKLVSDTWVRAGHVYGDNRHNISCTISVKPDEWSELTDWMWDNRDCYNGISILPYDGGTYVQAPFEDISEREYRRLLPHLSKINIADVLEENGDGVDLISEVACAGGVCELT